MSEAAPHWGGSLRDEGPEEPGELGILLQPAGLTDPWIDGYMAGVCCAPRFMPPGVWLQPLLDIIAPEIEDEHKLERILALLSGRYNQMLIKLRTPFGVALLPDGETALSIWADGYLTTWVGNPIHWPIDQLNAADENARALLEAAADWRPDAATMARALPPWMRDRYQRQPGLA